MLDNAKANINTIHRGLAERKSDPRLSSTDPTKIRSRLEEIFLEEKFGSLQSMYAESEGLIAVKVQDKWGFVDALSLDLVIDFRYDWVFSFDGGKAWVGCGSNSFFVDKSGNMV